MRLLTRPYGIIIELRSTQTLRKSTYVKQPTTKQALVHPLPTTLCTEHTKKTPLINVKSTPALHHITKHSYINVTSTPALHQYNKTHPLKSYINLISTPAHHQYLNPQSSIHINPQTSLGPRSSLYVDYWSDTTCGGRIEVELTNWAWAGP
jgi:hypothetical protein